MLGDLELYYFYNALSKNKGLLFSTCSVMDKDASHGSGIDSGSAGGVDRRRSADNFTGADQLNAPVVILRTDDEVQLKRAQVQLKRAQRLIAEDRAAVSTVDTMARLTAQYESVQKEVAASKEAADFDPADFLHVARVARLNHVKAELTKLMHRTAAAASAAGSAD